MVIPNPDYNSENVEASSIYSVDKAVEIYKK
jgi:hypothetical protein